MAEGEQLRRDFVLLQRSVVVTTAIFLFGAACFLTGILAGPIEVAGNALPGPSGTWQRVVLTVFGATLMTLSVSVRRSDPVTSARDQQLRELLLTKFRAHWISGLLEESLRDVPFLRIPTQESPDAVEAQVALLSPAIPWEKPVVMRQSITEAFDDSGGSLLILGDPGTGKTTMLLGLARDLLDRAAADARKPLPLVLPLLLWHRTRGRRWRDRLRQASFAGWVTSELARNFPISPRTARKWLKGGAFDLLLDGLDEVDDREREACLAAVNGFIGLNRQVRVAVTAREAEYAALGQKLILARALRLRRLSQPEVERILAAHGPNDVAATDANLAELVDTPLMLQILLRTQEGGSMLSEMPSDEDVAERRSKLLALYVREMVRRRLRQSRNPYTVERTISWLVNIAESFKGLREHIINPRFVMPWDGVRWRYAPLILSTVIGAAQGWIVASTSSGRLSWRGSLALGVGFAIGAGPLAHLSGRYVTENLFGIDWDWWRIVAKYSAGTLVGLALLAALWELFEVPRRAGELTAYFVTLSLVLVATIFAVLVTAIIDDAELFLVGPLLAVQVMFIAVIAGAASIVVIAVTVGWVVAASAMAGLTVGLLVGIICGFGSYPTQLVYRTELVTRKLLPRRLGRFLSFANECALMSRVGSSYRFSHAVLEDHFAAAEAGQTAPE